MDKNIFLETERCYLRRMTFNDFGELAAMLQDIEVMYAWEYSFSDEEVKDWINKNLELYNRCNSGYFLVEDKISSNIFGQAALMPDVVNGKEYYEVGYIFKKQYWHKGYATECARALVKYAFEKLNLSEVIFEIRPENTASRNVAKRLGACVEGEFVKNVRGKDMRHLIYKLYKN